MSTWVGRVKEGFRQIKNNSLFKKTILVTSLGMGVALGSVYADSLNDSFVDVYHVYVDEKHVGTIESKNELEQYIEKKETQAEKEYDHIDLLPEQDISYVKEIVFTPKDEIDQVKNSLENTLTFSASAVKLQIGDKLIGYVEDLDAANKAINKVVSQYLPEGISEDFEFLKKEDNQIKKSSLLSHLPSDVKAIAKDSEKNKEQIKLNDGTIVTDIGLTENIHFTNDTVEPNQLLTAEQLQKLLERGAKGKKVHTIQQNEVLGQVAMDYDLSMDELLDLNPDLGKNSIVQVGQEVYVEGRKPYIDVSYTVIKEEEESIDFETVTKSTDSLYKGQTEVEDPGKEGKKLVKYRVTTKNNEEVSKEKIEEEVIEEPQQKVVLQGTKVIPSRGTGQFSWPASGGRITSYMGPRWGRSHKGIDIAGTSNRTIKAADNGVVTSAGWDGTYGYKVEIDHNNGYKTLYAHLSSIKVEVGQTVKKGHQIGVMGSTGRSTGVHLHFEVFKNGSNVNPLNYY
ncbi:M23 family metallopeptidase [Tenuibacillus multivorans]|uniref:Murein DD-endopeptidase MepM and murein hydrolase activator NlpD, contain LysM domain n=1 Tax=Tenuibacillus multivorans TaxID=237069 RepID=A0A1G9W8X0_9BACI|nr:M23 family metallopeptidase [Tenuibacillus multivorans]GEL76349.1 metalloendopeptidase [Tenuibacillus multivorans]SDM80681.1 Murein DD-endopeptidase MepM and murein hydrolase activator NlpD, contain LysM domain [Tenuibacillus multivorans]